MIIKKEDGMDKTLFTFDLVDTLKPEEVISNSIKQIEEATQGYVIGKIEPYSGKIRSYTKKTGLANALATMQQSEVNVDIQKHLGEQGQAQNRYEVFLAVKGLEHYKYRMMFIDYGSISYPVTVVMNETLAKECNRRISSYVFTVKSMKELETMIDSVINSTTMIALIQSLINEALRNAEKISDDGEE